MDYTHPNDHNYSAYLWNDSWVQSLSLRPLKGKKLQVTWPWNLVAILSERQLTEKEEIILTVTFLFEGVKATSVHFCILVVSAAKKTNSLPLFPNINFWIFSLEFFSGIVQEWSQGRDVNDNWFFLGITTVYLSLIPKKLSNTKIYAEPTVTFCP